MRLRSRPHHLLPNVVALFATCSEVTARLGNESTGHKCSTASLVVEVADSKDRRRRCSECGQPVRRSMKRGIAAGAAEQRPTEDEAWSAFWKHLAVIWASLPADVQQECMAETVERGGTRGRAA